MMDYFTKRSIKKIQYKDDDFIRPKQNLYPFWPVLKSLDCIEQYWKIGAKYGPRSTLITRNNFKIYTALNSVSNLAIGLKIVRFMKIYRSNFALFNTMAPTIIFSTLFGCGIHMYFVTNSRVINPIDEPYWTIFRSSLFHFGTSTIYPIIFCGFSSIYFALKHHTYPLPNDLGLKSVESRNYINKNVLQVMIKHQYKFWLTMGLINVLISASLTYLECNEIALMFYRELDHYRQTESNSDSIKSKSILTKNQL